jgi:hypothetical protein
MNAPHIPTALPPVRDRASAGESALPPPNCCAAPSWCSLVRRYLDGDARAGVRAANSVRRWRQRMYPV